MQCGKRVLKRLAAIRSTDRNARHRVKPIPRNILPKHRLRYKVELLVWREIIILVAHAAILMPVHLNRAAFGTMIGWPRVEELRSVARPAKLVVEEADARVPMCRRFSSEQSWRR